MEVGHRELASVLPKPGDEPIPFGPKFGYGGQRLGGQRQRGARHRLGDRGQVVREPHEEQLVHHLGRGRQVPDPGAGHGERL